MGLYLTNSNDQASHDNSIVCKPITSHIEYIESIAETWRYLSMKQHINTDDWSRTCCIETNINATDFNLTPMEKNQLLIDGKKGLENFIKKLETKIIS
jgi:hypothetical protein